VEIFSHTPGSYWNLLLPTDDPNYPWLAIVLGYPVMGVWFWCTDQSMVQSVLGAKNLTHGQLGANFTGWLKILDVALFIIPGVTCFVLFPGLKNPDEAYMTMVTRLLPSGLIGMVMAVLIAALVSTIDSALNSLSTVFTMDIYVKKFKPQATQKEIINIGRVVTVLGAVTAVFMALAIDSIKGLNLFDIFQAILGFIAPPMSVVFLLGVLWKRMTRRAANFTLSAGAIFSFGTGIAYLWIFPKEQYDFWPHFLLLSFIIFFVLACLAVIISLAGRKEEDQNTLIAGNIPKPSKQVWMLWAFLILVMLGLYVIFNGH
jgi:SSS family solute:Na+ symporter